MSVRRGHAGKVDVRRMEDYERQESLKLESVEEGTQPQA